MKARMGPIDILAEAIWRAGPGDPTLLIVDDDEFKGFVASCGHAFVVHAGYNCIAIQRYGSTVYVSCPRMKLMENHPCA